MDEAMLVEIEEPVEETAAEAVDVAELETDVEAAELEEGAQEEFPIYPPDQIPFELLDFDDELPVIVAEPAVNCANPELASTELEKEHSIYISARFQPDFDGTRRYVFDVSIPNHEQTEEHHIEKLYFRTIFRDVHHVDEINTIDVLPLSSTRKKLKFRFVADINAGYRFAIRAICNKDGIWEASYPIPSEWGISIYPDPADTIE